jgi:hypothetical protein
MLILSVVVIFLYCYNLMVQTYTRFSKIRVAKNDK